MTLGVDMARYKELASLGLRAEFNDWLRDEGLWHEYCTEVTFETEDLRFGHVRQYVRNEHGKLFVDEATGLPAERRVVRRYSTPPPLDCLVELGAW